MSSIIRVYVKLPSPKEIIGLPAPKSLVTLATFRSEDNPTFFHLWTHFRHFILCVSSRDTPHVDLSTPLSSLTDKRIYAVHWTPSHGDLRTKMIAEWNLLERRALDAEIDTLERRLASAKRQRASLDFSSSDDF